jgi:hypothetical protein
MPVGAWSCKPHRILWAECLENVGLDGCKPFWPARPVTRIALRVRTIVICVRGENLEHFRVKIILVILTVVACSWESYVTTDGQSASQYWCHAPIWGPWPDLYYCQTVADFMWDSHSDERTVCSLQLLLVLASADILWLETRRIVTIFYCHNFRLPQPGGPGPFIYMPHSDRVAQLYSKSLRSLSVASYCSQGYDGGIHPASTQTTQKTPRPLCLPGLCRATAPCLMTSSHLLLYSCVTQTTQKTPRSLLFTRIMERNGSLFNDVIIFTVP